DHGEHDEDHADHEQDDHGDESAEAEVADEAAAAGAEQQEDPQPRLLLGDGANGRIEVLDLVSGEVVDTLQTDGLAAMHAADRFVFAVDSDRDLVTVVDGGSWVVDHGDHSHAYTSDPAV